MSGITNPAEEYFKDGLWGWDGSVWRKLPMLWGYSDRWAEVQDHDMTSDATYSFDTVAVPAGYVYKLEHATIANQSAVRGMAYIAISLSAIAYPLVLTLEPARYQAVTWTGSLTLKEGDKIIFRQLSCITDDVIRAAAWGCKMKIAE